MIRYTWSNGIQGKTNFNKITNKPMFRFKTKVMLIIDRLIFLLSKVINKKTSDQG